jgi:hypothetical protein
LNIQQFITEHASAVFALLGVLGGGLLSFFGSLLLKKRDFNLRLWDKLIERRIKAHENVMALAVEMRIMVPIGGVDQDGDVRRAPQVLISKEEFDRWLTRFTQLSMEGTTWLTTDAKRELNFAQDYLVTLHQSISGIPSEKYLAVGNIIRGDFIDISSSLEKKSFEFFESGIRKLKLDSLNKWHKYKRPVTESRLKQTALLRNWETISKVVAISSDGHQ